MMKTPDTKILQVIQYVSLLLTVLFSTGGLYLRNPIFAVSVLVGAVLVNGSFWVLKRDASRILDKVVAATDGGSVKSVQRVERIRFIVKFYAKLIVLGLLLYAVSIRMQLDMIGVALGLSTVMLSVIVVVLGGGRKFYSMQSAKGV